MATFVLTNLASTKTLVGDFYGVNLEPAGETGDSVTLEDRSLDEVPGLSRTMELVADGTITFSVTPSADEIASGLASPPNAISGDDFVEVAAADALSGHSLIRVPLVAGGGGSPDDVTVYAVNTLPFKMRIVDAWAFVSTAVAASTVTVQDEAAAAGTEAFSLDSSTTGRKTPDADDGTHVYTPSATTGLFIRRSDDAVAGEVYLLVRRET